jgi:hypothetical protein
MWKYTVVFFLLALNVQYLQAQDAIPVVDQVNNIYIKSGDSVPAITFTGTGDIYYWSANGSNIGMTNISGVNTIPMFVAINHGNEMLSTTITVRPMKINSIIDTILGSPMSFTINVYGDSTDWNDTIGWQDTLAPYVNPVPDKYCYNGTFIYAITFTGNADTYNWNITGDNIGLATTSGTNMIPSFTAINNGLTTLTATVTVTPQKTINGNLVNGNPISFNFYVYSDTVDWNDTIGWGDTLAPYVNFVSDKYYFDGTQVQTVTFTGDADTYYWNVAGDNIGLATTSGTNFIPSFTAVNNGFTTLTATVTVTPQKTINGNLVNGNPVSFKYYIYRDTVDWNDTIGWGDTSTVSVNGIYVSPKYLTMNIGDYKDIFVFVYPYNADNRSYTFQIGDPNVVSVDTFFMWDSVFVQGLSAGSTYIVFTTVDGGYSDTCWVTVTENDRDSTCNSSISGRVYFENINTLCDGYVFLYKQNSAGGYICVDTAILDTVGYYYFPNVEQGIYLLQALETTISNAVPTYYRSADAWYLADTIMVSSCNPNWGIDIQMITLDSLTGSSSISGYVGDDGDGTKSMHKTAVENPYEGATVILQGKDSKVTIAITQTDENGFFEFKNIPVGNYVIIINITGLDMNSYHEVEITEDGEIIEDQNYWICEDGIKTEKSTSSIKEPLTDITLTIYPNPVKDQINIETGNTYIENISLFNIAGQEVKRFTIQSEDNVISLDINELPQGVYILVIKTENIMLTQKVIKQ